ncbi:MAG: TetR family transcriptional regulator [Ilumatobacteraceae bacterium]|nr:TetR family transcriptional regulator [Ilumatobacteraceae bacterium]
MAAAVLPARRGRRRSGAADEAILAATLDVLAADGYGGLTMAAVIARAGTSSATLYRRWPTKQHLVAAALASLHSEVVDVDTGTLAGDIAALVDSIAGMLSTRRDDISDQIAVELGRNPEFRAAVNEKFVAPRIEVLEQILRRARKRGDIGNGIDTSVAYSFISGPINHRMYSLREPVTPQFCRTVVTGVVAALSAIAPPRR